MTDEQFALIIKLASFILCTIITYVIVPRIKDGRIKERVRTFVRAADKLARSGQIESDTKLEYVITMLENCGVNVSEQVRAVIEAEVTELDLAIGEIVKASEE